MTAQTEAAPRLFFNPEPHLMNLKGKAYLQVAHRIQWLATDIAEQDYHRYSVHTELLREDSWEDEKLKRRVREAVFKATVTLFDRAGNVIKTATGHGSETSTDFGDYLEKAETKALGRALAVAGFGTQFALPDLEEGQKPSPIDGEVGPAVADSPVRVPAAKPAPAARPAPAAASKPAPAATPAAPAPAAPSTTFNREEAIQWLRPKAANQEVASVLTAAMTKAKVSKVSDLTDASLQEAVQAIKQLGIA